MAAHLRPLPRCRVCGRPATEALYTTRNDLIAEYCTRHAQKALRDWQAKHPGEL